MPLNKHCLTSPDGAQHQLVLSDKAGHSESPIILCIPAMGVPARKYLPLAEALTRQKLAAGIFELRGIDTSSVRASRVNDFGYHELVNLDLPVAIERIRRDFADNPIYLLGHSLGGQLALLYMTRNPGQISGHIGVATGLPHYKSWPFPKNVGLWSASKLIRLISATVGHYPGRRLGFAGREARQIMSDWAYSVITGDYRINGQAVTLEEIEAKRSLMITIEEDWMAPPHSARRLGEKLTHTTAEYIHLTGRDFKRESLGHFNWMKEPEPVAKQILQWLKK